MNHPQHWMMEETTFKDESEPLYIHRTLQAVWLHNARSLQWHFGTPLLGQGKYFSHSLRKNFNFKIPIPCIFLYPMLPIYVFHAELITDYIKWLVCEAT